MAKKAKAAMHNLCADPGIYTGILYICNMFPRPKTLLQQSDSKYHVCSLFPSVSPSTPGSRISEAVLASGASPSLVLGLARASTGLGVTVDAI